MNYYTLKVIDLRPETTDTVTLVFRQPALKKIKYLAGQYLTLIFRINGRRYIRPYSFSSAPTVDANLEITVKRVLGGIISNHIIDKVRIGDLIEVIEPMGDFTINNNLGTEKHLVLWGAGSGITPLISIAKYVLYNKSITHLTLVYGNRSRENVIFERVIKQLKKDYSQMFTSWHFYTQSYLSVEEPFVINGQINAQKVLAVINLDNTMHYICGPAGLKESVKEALKGSGITNNRIISEDFQIERNTEDFEDIITQNVEFIMQDKLYLIEVTKGKSILEAGLDAGIELNYSCQTGTCTLCKAKLINGKVKTIGHEELNDAIDKDERLLCCSYPLTDNVKFEII